MIDGPLLTKNGYKVKRATSQFYAHLKPILIPRTHNKNVGIYTKIYKTNIHKVTKNENHKPHFQQNIKEVLNTEQMTTDQTSENTRHLQKEE